jgi:hypothetical protein
MREIKTYSFLDGSHHGDIPAKRFLVVCDNRLTCVRRNSTTSSAQINAVFPKSETLSGHHIKSNRLPAVIRASATEWSCPGVHCCLYHVTTVDDLSNTWLTPGFSEFRFETAGFFFLYFTLSSSYKAFHLRFS